MLLFLIIFFLLSAVMFLILSCTRRYQLGRFAERYAMQYDYYRESVTTFETAGRLEFFTQFFHQYNNVCTFSSNSAFMRLADDIIFEDDKPGTKSQKISIFTAELKNHQFLPFKIVPVNSVFARSQYPQLKTNVPELYNRYQIYSPIENTVSFLTPALQSLLKNRDNIYLEANDNAIIYHEHALIKPQDLQMFRLRGMQLSQECERALTPQPNGPALTRPTDNANEETLLSSLSLPQDKQNTPNMRMGIGVFALVLLAVGLTLFAWLLVRNLPH